MYWHMLCCQYALPSLAIRSGSRSRCICKLSNSGAFHAEPLTHDNSLRVLSCPNNQNPKIQEDDFGHIVGLGLLMWLFLCSFIVLSAAIGKRPCQPPTSMLAVCTASSPRHPSCTLIDIRFAKAFEPLHFCFANVSIPCADVGWLRKGYCVWTFTIISGVRCALCLLAALL